MLGNPKSGRSMNLGRWVVACLCAAIGAAAALAVGACGGDDRGEVELEGGTGTTGTGTTSTATVDTTATDPAALEAAMQKVTVYARGQTAQLVAATRRLESAISAGDLPGAKRAYAAGRPYYERIEPLVALFPELDGLIDAREDDFPKKAADPKWTGFHPIERKLWKERRIDARTRALAVRLVRTRGGSTR